LPLALNLLAARELFLRSGKQTTGTGFDCLFFLAADGLRPWRRVRSSCWRKFFT